MNDKSNSRIITIFKYFIQFLEIYGTENYGESAEVNWETVWNFVNKCGILDNNRELENLVHYSSDEEFRNTVFSYVEKQALEGYPLWRLFTMSKWLSDKCEQELNDIEHKKDVEYFNKVKCYKCKYFNCKISTIGHTMIEPIMSKSFNNVAELKEFVQETQYVIQRDILEMNCLKREQLLNQRRSNSRRKFWGSESSFRYKGFNSDSYRHKWELNPSHLLDCPYYKEDESITVKKFEELYYEIPRYLD